MITTTDYKGYGLEIGSSKTVVVRWGVVHGQFETSGEARAFIDGRCAMETELKSLK